MNKNLVLKKEQKKKVSMILCPGKRQFFWIDE